VKLALTLFEWLMLLLPRSYGRQQRADAVALTAELVREARGRGGVLASMRVVAAALLDLVLQIARGWTRPARAFLSTRGLLRDLHHGFRVMGAKPGHSAAVIITLALGIGLNAAVFSVVDWVLLRPLPYPAPESLVRVWASDKSSPGAAGALSYSEVAAFSNAASFRGGAASSIVTRVAHAPSLDPLHVTIARVTGDLFGVLAVYPAIGRAFDANELASGRPVVVLSHAVWRTRFGSNPAIVGGVITIDNQPHTVVGVMPAGRGYPHEADIWRPLTADEREDDDPENVMVARLADGASDAAATSELSTLWPALSERPRVEGPASREASERLVWVDSLQATEVRGVRAVLIWALAGAALVLVVACANVAALSGARGLDRAGELAIRGALGASRGELGRQLLVEGMLLALAGGALGIIVGALALDLLVALAPAGLPRLDEITLDARVMSVSAAVMVLVGIVVSVAPARQAARTDLTTTLNAAASSRTVARVGPRRLLVTAQIAVAVALSVGAMLLSRSLQHLVSIDHGFQPTGVTAVSLNVRGMTPDAARTLFLTLADEASTVPGVSSAAVAFRLPTDVVGLRAPMRVDNATSNRTTSVAVRVVTPGYFETVGVALVAGRGLGVADTRQRPRVGLVNRAFVREVLGAGPAVDVRLTSELIEGGVTIVGVTDDVTPSGQPDRPALYMSYDQFSINAGTLVVKASGDASALIPALRSRLRASAPSLPLDRIETLDDVLAAGRAVVRFNSLVAASFGMLAFTLAIIGVYGLANREVATRRRESGLRAALGASRSSVVWELLRPVAALLAGGLSSGIGLAFGMSASMRSLLHGISPTDPLTLAVVPAVVGLVAASAALAAAWPVAHADPASTLR
jgi:putative ABC transport system permease protein